MLSSIRIRFRRMFNSMNIKKLFSLSFAFLILVPFLILPAAAATSNISDFSISYQTYTDDQLSEQVYDSLVIGSVFKWTAVNYSKCINRIWCSFDNGSPSFVDQGFTFFYMPTGTYLNFSVDIEVVLPSDKYPFKQIYSTPFTTEAASIPTDAVGVSLGIRDYQNFTNVVDFSDKINCVNLPSSSQYTQSFRVSGNIPIVSSLQFFSCFELDLKFGILATGSYEEELTCFGKFTEFSYGDIIINSVNRDNLDDVQSGQAEVEGSISDIESQKGVGSLPTANINSLLNSGNFRRFVNIVNKVYALPLLSTWTSYTITFAVLFFLLKKR